MVESNLTLLFDQRNEMTIPLLQTKLFIPSPRGLISRPYLIQRLEEGRQATHALTLISSSAGSGKTSLLCEWSAHSRSQFAWFSIDSEDNESVRFWMYLLAALQRAQPGFGQSAAQLLANPQPIPIQTVLISLINELTDQAKPIVLVLDDYHFVSNGEIHDGIAFLLEHLPSHVGLAISTRADPPLPVFRLRAHNQLTEIREADLRFSADEAEIFLRKVMSLNLTKDEIQALENRTEGWIAGLQLAALAIRAPSPRESHEFIASFTGGQEFILEYLAEEVLARQSKPVQDFLIKTSILQRMCGPLCDALILGEVRTPVDAASLARGHAMLEYLEHSNLFTFPQDPEHQWFRYHRLFADLLASRLHSVMSHQDINELHRRAADWLAQNDLTDEAIQHALEAKDYEKAAAFIESVARSMMFTGRVNQLKSWLKAFPEPILHAHLRLNIYRVWIDYLQGICELSEQNLQETDQLIAALPPSPENDRLKVELMVVLCRFVSLLGNSARAIRMANEALSYLPEDDLASRARAQSALSISYGIDGQVEKAEQAFRECFRLAEASNYYSLAAHTTMLVAMGQANYGKLRGPARDLQAVLDMADRAGQRIFFPAGQAYIGLSNIYLEWNDLQAAEKYVEQGMALCQQGGLDGIFYGLTIRSRLRQARGDLQGALEDIHTAEQTMNRKDHTTFSRQVQIRIAMGDMDGLRQLEAALKAVLLTGPDRLRIPIMFNEILQVSQIRILLAYGEIRQALQLMDELQVAAEAGGRFGRLIEVYLLRALALQRQKQGKISVEAYDNIWHALDLAEPEGYVRLFLDEGPEVVPLLRAAEKDGAAPEQLKNYASRLLDAFSTRSKPAASSAVVTVKMGEPEGQPIHELLVEPLSKREVEILRLIGEGLSNQEISDLLVITLHTVKKHSSNIFEKLGVNSRTQAVARAHQLGLL